MCTRCGWVSLSDQQPHRMDFCKCKTHPTGVDHEVDLLRISGDNYKFIALIDLDKKEVEMTKKLKIKEYQPNKFNIIVGTVLGLPGVVYLMTCFAVDRFMKGLRR